MRDVGKRKMNMAKVAFVLGHVDDVHVQAWPVEIPSFKVDNVPKIEGAVGTRGNFNATI
jgi:hypothetical protein